MMPKYDTGSAVVMTRPGSGTADTIYICNDGSEWETYHGPSPATLTAGPQLARAINGRMVRI